MLAPPFLSSNALSCPTLWPQGLEPARLLCPWDSPGNNTGVGCCALLQRDLPDPGIEPSSLVSPALSGRFLTTEQPGDLFLNRYWKQVELLFSESPFLDSRPHLSLQIHWHHQWGSEFLPLNSWPQLPDCTLTLAFPALIQKRPDV